MRGQHYYIGLGKYKKLGPKSILVVGRLSSQTRNEKPQYKTKHLYNFTF